MKVLNYKYILPQENGIVDGLTRSDYMSTWYIDKSRGFLDSMELKGRVAFLYAGGATLPASESRVTEVKRSYREEPMKSGMVVRELSAFCMHKWIGALNDRHLIQYANINANTCASSMYSLYEAEQLLSNGFDQVVIVAEERTTYNTLRLFDEMGIDLKVSEGLAIIHLGKASSYGTEDITSCKVWYEWNRNPFGTTSNGYMEVYSECDFINPHGTGTENNETAEEVYKHKPQLRYKEMYGHTQGVSGLLEVCLVLDEQVTGDVLCVSSGLGGFYASCIVHK